MSFTIDELRDRLRDMEGELDKRDPATRHFYITAKERNNWLREQSRPTATVQGRVEPVSIESAGGGLFKVSLIRNTKTTLPPAVREAVGRLRRDTESGLQSDRHSADLRTILDHLEPKEREDEKETTSACERSCANLAATPTARTQPHDRKTLDDTRRGRLR